VRIGKILRIIPARSIPPRDTARRICRGAAGGGPDIASRVVSRIRERLSTEPEHPALSVSAGWRPFRKMATRPKNYLVPRTARSTP